MCHFETSWEEESDQTEMLFSGLEKLKEMQDDGLVILKEKRLIVPEKGRLFVRNICMCFDARMIRNKPTTKIFSQTV